MEREFLRQFLNKAVQVVYIDSGSDVYVKGLCVDLTDEFIVLNYNSIARVIRLDRLVSIREVSP